MITTALLTKSDFEGHPIYLSLNEFSGEEQLNNIIITYQNELLRDILGDVEFNNFSSDLVAGVPQTQKWLDFYNGKSYTVNSKTVVWNGVKHLLKHFIFYYFLKDISELTTSIANIAPQFANATPKSFRDKMVTVWNIGLDYYGFDWNYKFYDEKTVGYNSDIEQYKPTVYNYLYNHLVDYPDWIFTETAPINNI